MLVKTWRLLTIMFTALSLGPALGHLLELPAKMTYEGALWLTVSQTHRRGWQSSVTDNKPRR